VLGEIDELNITKSPGLDGNGPKTVKNVAHIIAKPLTYLYNIVSGCME
jgi:hypothetical protein